MSTQPSTTTVWYKQKTLWMGVSAIVTAVGAYVCADAPDKGQLITTIATAILGIIARQFSKD